MNEPLKIGLLAPPWAATPPPGYGGTESVVCQLAQGLAATGHEVVLYATGDSTARVPIAYTMATADWARVGRGEVEMPHVMGGYEALAGCDVIHDHTLLGPAWAMASGYDRVVTTCHGPFSGELRAIYRRYGKRLPVVAISHDQAAHAPEIAVDRVIHHGLDPAGYPVGRGDGGYLLFLGRMTPDKGVREAILAARAAGQPLVIAAKNREPLERAYFAERILPLLTDDVTFVGEVAGAAKLALLGHAKALLNPIQWAEPFGLVMIEAMACGTPVITCPNGAAPEIVDHGSTGYLCADAAELVAAIHSVERLSRAACRAAVLQRFSTTRMVTDHLALYADMVSR
ncbi:glycosyltransferase family 4 protein [Mycolicibacterium sp. 050158]|uniref:glycosyltransferase family 4 protein n=1 Tax=Mycolicibacterium sp. 050158 TaxID=3090602 RepID=UPI00299E3C5B|nr:glycosyltransferase family 4 protein [Mycolicibacterium sp. 050158]MDX1888815.1 glycosyltransferase family 4 protein [Mycolicibacterium sp. 050158]